MNGRRIRFGTFEADVTSGELWREGAPVAIQDLPFRLLAALVEQPGTIVTRAELAAKLWGADTFVDATAGVNTAVAKLREALGDNADHPAFIETVPKRGYRFIGHVEPAAVDALASDDARSIDTTPVVAAGQHAAASPDSDAVPPAPIASAATLRWTTLALAVVAVLGIAAYQLRADRARVRVAVVLFDNETGRPELASFAQGLTDATVAELTAERRLAVIGNAAVLRTERPFRNIAQIRDALGADFIVIGQVQSRDGATIVRAHLIRARDQSHVWVDVATFANTNEAGFQADVAGRIRAAVAANAVP